MAPKPLDLPERGWGMALEAFFQDGVTVHNHAMNGRSTKSFIDEDRWAKLLADLRAGDFVVIQFAHNDEKKEDPKRYADPANAFRANLRRFIAETRAKGATPLLATPVCRRKFDASGRLVDTHGEYPAAVRAVAQEEKIALLDLERATAAWLQAAGAEPSKKFFMWIEPGTHPKIPDGRKGPGRGRTGRGADPRTAPAAGALAAGARKESPLTLRRSYALCGCDYCQRTLGRFSGYRQNRLTVLPKPA